jgi:CBS domain-containing protein
MIDMLPPAEYLSRIKPFSFLSNEELAEFTRRMEVVFYRAGKTVFKSGKILKRIYFIREGKIGLFNGKDLVEIAGRDEMIEIKSSILGHETEFTARAMEDSVLFEIDSEVVNKIMERNRNFGEFLKRFLSRKFLSLLRLLDTERIEDIYADPVNSLIKKSPIFCFKGQSIKETVRLMNTHKVGSVVVVDSGMFPVGIVTHTDIVRVFDENIPLENSVESIMSSPVVAIDSEGSIMDAYIKFITNDINHLAVVEDGKLTGVVSIKDILSRLEAHSSLLSVSKDIIKSKTPDEIRNASTEINRLILNMFTSGFDYSSISTVISTQTDILIRKILLSSLGKENNLVIAPFGDYGRRELIFPLRIGLLIVGDRHYCREVESSIINTVSNIEVESIECCPVNEIGEYLKNLNSEMFLNLIDSRYLYGNGSFYINFRKVFASSINDELAVSMIRKLARLDKVDHENMSKIIAEGIKAVSLLHGDITSRPTWDRIKILSDKGVIDKELSDSLKEAYMALKNIELKGKLKGGQGMIEKILVKKTSEVIREMQAWMAEYLD